MASGKLAASQHRGQLVEGILYLDGAPLFFFGASARVGEEEGSEGGPAAAGASVKARKEEEEGGGAVGAEESRRARRERGERERVEVDEESESEEGESEFRAAFLRSACVVLAFLPSRVTRTVSSSLSRSCSFASFFSRCLRPIFEGVRGRRLRRREINYENATSWEFSL